MIKSVMYSFGGLTCEMSAINFAAALRKRGVQDIMVDSFQKNSMSVIIPTGYEDLADDIYAKGF